MLDLGIRLRTESVSDGWYCGDKTLVKDGIQGVRSSVFRCVEIYDLIYAEIPWYC